VAVECSSVILIFYCIKQIIITIAFEFNYVHLKIAEIKLRQKAAQSRQFRKDCVPRRLNVESEITGGQRCELENFIFSLISRREFGTVEMMWKMEQLIQKFLNGPKLEHVFLLTVFHKQT
jgi:hypothetical protein